MTLDDVRAQLSAEVGKVMDEEYAKVQQAIKDRCEAIFSRWETQPTLWEGLALGECPATAFFVERTYDQRGVEYHVNVAFGPKKENQHAT